MTTAVHILNASALQDRALDTLAVTVQQVFKLPVYVEHSTIDVSKTFDNSRGQYHSTMLIGHVLSNNNTKNDKWIIIVDVDLFIPVLTFVFGEAQLAGNAAVVSTYRLANQFYGLPGNNELLMQRLEKEVVHELGHTFGLYHCHQFECVMRSSTYVEEIDLKHVLPCSSCHETLGQFLFQQTTT